MLLLSLLVPSFAFAEDAPTTAAKPTLLRTGAAGENFCTIIDSITVKVEGAISEREGKYQSNRTQRRTKLDERFKERDDKRATNRSDWDTRRSEWQIKLSDRASTTEAKARVTAFIAEIDMAVAARKTAVDAAVATYRNGINSEVASRQTLVDQYAATFKSETDAALTKAKTDCAGTVTPKMVRTTYVASMKAAREKLKTSIAAIEKRKDAVQPLADARKAAVEKAIIDFKTAVTAAKEKLKAALK